MARRMAHGTGDAAQRPQARPRTVTDPLGAPHDDDGRDVRDQRGADMVDQAPPREQGRSLVAAETARLPARQDRTQDQAARSTRTGTDFAAGTRLCSA